MPDQTPDAPFTIPFDSLNRLVREAVDETKDLLEVYALEDRLEELDGRVRARLATKNPEKRDWKLVLLMRKHERVVQRLCARKSRWTGGGGGVDSC